MVPRIVPLALGLLLVGCTLAVADDLAPTEMEQRFAAVERQNTAPYPVRPAQYALGPTEMLPPPVATGPAYPTPNFPAPNYPPPVAPASPSGTVYIAPQGENAAPTNSDLVVVAPGCVSCNSVYRNSNWFISLDLIPTQSHLTRGQFGQWREDTELAARLNLGYEDPTGYGFRLRFWGLDQNAPPPADIELQASTFDFDIYKKLFIEDSELTFGGGPAGSHLEFIFPNNDYSRFEGGGITLFVEGYHPIARWTKTDLGAVARGRMSLLEGEWRDTTGTVVPSTNHDSMLILDVAWGLELRHRFGSCEDHFWFADLVFEHQRWESACMTDFAGTAVAFSGVNLGIGLAW